MKSKKQDVDGDPDALLYVPFAEAVLERIDGYDRAIIRERLERARFRYEQAKEARREWETCLFVTASALRLTRCQAPAVYYDRRGAISYCEQHRGLLHLENGGPEEESYTRSIAFGAFSFGVSENLPEAVKVLKDLVLFQAIGDEELYLDFRDEGICVHSRSIDPLFDEAIASRRRFTSSAIVLLKDWVGEIIERDLVSEEEQDWAERAAVRAERYVSWNAGARLSSLLEAVYRESVFHALDEPMTEAQRRQLEALTGPGEEIAYHSLRLTRAPGHDFNRLKTYYGPLKEVWDNAREQARAAQEDPVRRERWRQIIATSYQTPLPAYLIEWLNVFEAEKRSRLFTREDLPRLQQRLRDGYSLAGCSEIALEHAARMCGASPYEFAISTLHQYRRNPPAMKESED